MGGGRGEGLFGVLTNKVYYRYLISIKDKTAKDKPHLLGAFGYQERNEWWNHLSAATAAVAAAAQEPAAANEDADKEIAA